MDRGWRKCGSRDDHKWTYFDSTPYTIYVCDRCGLVNGVVYDVTGFSEPITYFAESVSDVIDLLAVAEVVEG
jgi:hypothetical protein